MDAVCFDMDGVLVNSEDYWIELEREEILPTVCPNDDVPIEAVSGIYYEELYDVLNEDYDVVVDYDEFVSLFEGAATEIYHDRVELTDGIPELLADLRDRGVALAMVTASPPDWYGVVLDRFDLRDAFDAVVCADDVDGPGKPDPAIYERAAAELGVEPSTAVAVEDSVHGTTSAHRAGMTVVGFGVGDAGGGLDGADVVAETPADLRRILLERA